MFLHPYQVYDLRTNTSTGQWLDIQKAALAGGADSKSPIYTGALGEYNGVILHANSRVPYGVNGSSAVTTTRRAIFCGAQAGLMAYGQKDQSAEMSWVEELFDYQNQLGVSAGMIAGMKKTQFNSEDFCVITVSSYAAAH
jgi:N4-gp56 family major capsid protein